MAVAQAACICGNRGSIYSFIILDDVAPAIPYFLRIKNKQNNYISNTYCLLFIWSNRVYSLFDQNTE